MNHFSSSFDWFQLVAVNAINWPFSAEKLKYYFSDKNLNLHYIELNSSFNYFVARYCFINEFLYIDELPTTSHFAGFSLLVFFSLKTVCAS